MRKLTIAVDFDGTLVEHKFPVIGEAYPGAFEAVLALQSQGHDIMLFTCREDVEESNYLTEAVEYCRSKGVEFVSVNENTPYYKAKGFACRKPYFDILIDDRSGFLPEYWDNIQAWVDYEAEKLALPNYKDGE